MNPNAKPFVRIVKSVRYYAPNRPGDFENIKSLFAGFQWPAWVHTVYICNGWHEGFEDGRWVTYCGYSLNEDADTAKQHYYLN